MAIKGVSITVSYFAFNTSTNLYVTGDAANHTLRAECKRRDFRDVRIGRQRRRHGNNY